MIITRQKSVRRLAVLALFAILAVAAYGFAAVNVVPTSYAGDGPGTIDGFTISNIDYTLNPGNPTQMNAVEFDLTPNPGVNGEAYVEFRDGANALLGSSICTVDALGHATCNTGLAVSVLSAEILRVIAAQ